MDENQIKESLKRVFSRYEQSTEQKAQAKSEVMARMDQFLTE